MAELMGNVKESLRTCGGLFDLTDRRNVLASIFSGVLVSQSLSFYGCFTACFSEEKLFPFFFVLVHDWLVVYHRCGSNASRRIRIPSCLSRLRSCFDGCVGRVSYWHSLKSVFMRRIQKRRESVENKRKKPLPRTWRMRNFLYHMSDNKRKMSRIILVGFILRSVYFQYQLCVKWADSWRWIFIWMHGPKRSAHLAVHRVCFRLFGINCIYVDFVPNLRGRQP